MEGSEQIADQRSHSSPSAEARLQALEDKLAIFEIVTTYGLAIDGGAAAQVGQLFGDDGVFDSNGGVRGRAELEDLARVCGELETGFAHVAYLPIVKVEGDRATVICHTNSLQQQEGQNEYVVRMLSANRWELERVDGRWQVRTRKNRNLDGSAESKAMLADGVRDLRG